MKQMVARLSGVLELHIRIEKVMRSFDLALSASGLSITYIDFRALGCILSFGPISLKQASDSMEVPKTTMHYIIGKLENKGYVERTYSKRKGTPIFTCTTAGREAWGTAIGALLSGPFGSVLLEGVESGLEDIISLTRALWSAAGADAQNQPLRHESAILAALGAEALLQGPNQSCENSVGPAKAPRRSFLG